MATNKIKTNNNKEFNRRGRRDRRELTLKYKRGNRFNARVAKNAKYAKRTINYFLL